MEDCPQGGEEAVVHSVVGPDAMAGDDNALDFDHADNADRRSHRLCHGSRHVNHVGSNHVSAAKVYVAFRRMRDDDLLARRARRLGASGQWEGEECAYRQRWS